MHKKPAYQFYTGDWLKDPGLRSVSYASRGLWIDMLSLMHECDRRGYLQLNGLPVNAAQLARMTGGATDDVTHLLRELENSGVYSRTDDGMIYSRRMVRDEAKREKCSEAGKRGGGNPTFKGVSKGHNKGSPKQKQGSSPSGVSSDIESSDSIHPPPPSGSVRDDVEKLNPDAIQLLWNTLADSRLPRCLGLGKKRATAIRERLKEHPRLEDWEGAIVAVNQSKFHLGGGDGGWRASIDWLVRPGSIQKMLEAGTGGRAPRNAPRTLEASPKPTPAPTPEPLAAISHKAAARAGEEWPVVLERLAEDMDPEAFLTWIVPLACRGISEAGARLAAPSVFAQWWVINNYSERIAEALGIEVEGVCVEVDEGLMEAGGDGCAEQECPGNAPSDAQDGETLGEAISDMDSGMDARKSKGMAG